MLQLANTIIYHYALVEKDPGFHKKRSPKQTYHDVIFFFFFWKEELLPNVYFVCEM